MYVTAETLITAGSVLAALSAFAALAWKVFKWVNHQKEQDEELATVKADLEQSKKDHAAEIEKLRAEHKQEIYALRSHHDEDIKAITENHDAAIKAIQEEQTLVVYGLLACLKGLNEQGCDGPVSEAIDKIDKHLNKRAHSH